MKKIRNIGCLLLAVAMLLTTVSCGKAEEKTPTGDKGGNTAVNVPTANTEELAAPEYNVTDKVVEVIVDNDFTGQDTEKNAWARIEQSANNHYGIDLKPVVIPLEQQTTRIISMIASGSPPDIIETQKLPGWYPRMCKEGTFIAVNEYVNFEDKLWKDEVNAMSNYMLGDSYYALSLGAYSPVEMIYNKKLIREAGLTDPLELYKKGEWTWGKYEEYIAKLSGDEDGDGEIDVFGSDQHLMSHCYLTSMGTGITQIVGGKITLDPITGKNYETLGTFLNKMNNKQSLGYLPDVDGNDGMTVDLLAQDKMLFSFAGRWTILGNPALLAKRDKGDLALIMPPRYEDADDYYCYGITSGYAIPSSGNALGAIATLTATRLDDYPTKKRLEEVKASYIEDGWSESCAHILTYDIAGYEDAYQKVKLVSLGIDMFNSTLQTTINDLLYDPLYKGDAWNTTRGTYINKLQTAVDSANKLF